MTDETNTYGHRGAIILLWSTTTITAKASSILQTRSFRTNLVKGKYVEAEAEEIVIIENPEVQESVDDEPIDIAEEITTVPEEIEDPEKSDEPEPQELGVHTAPTDIEPVIDDDTVGLEEPIETDATEPEVETPIDSEENEDEHETKVQSTQ